MPEVKARTITGVVGIDLFLSNDDVSALCYRLREYLNLRKKHTNNLPDTWAEQLLVSLENARGQGCTMVARAK